MGAVAAGAAVRALWGLVLHQPFDHVYSDMSEYVSKAEKLALGGGLDPYDSFHPPLTYLLLAVPYRLLGVGSVGDWAAAILWVALSSAAVFFTWRLVRLLVGPATAAITALLCAFWPLHVTHAGFFLSETPALAFLSGGLWLSYRALSAPRGDWVTQGLLAGVVVGAAIAIRVQFALNLAIVVAVALASGRRNLRVFAAAAAGAAAVLAGVVAHNSLATGRVTGFDTHGGQVFFIGHCDVRKLTIAGDGLFYIWGPPPQAQRGAGRTYAFTDHVPWDEGFLYKGGLECIRDDGVAHLGLLVRSVSDMTATTMPWPQSNEPRLREVVTISNFLLTLLLPLVVVAGVVLARRRPRAWLAGEAQLLMHLSPFVLVAVLFALGEPRYRTPYDLFALALLGAALATLLRKDPSRA